MARGSFYPAFLDLRGKECLVVGGGAVAARKARALAACGARVRLVAPRASPRLLGLKNVRVARRAFLPQDLRASWLVIAATDDEAVNRRISALCRRRRIWVNVADRPALCGFILPSVVRRGGLTFAVSTGGASPALAKFVGRRLKQQFGPEYAALTARLRQQRPSLLKLPMPERKKLLRELFAGSLRRRGNGRALKTEPGRRG